MPTKLLYNLYIYNCVFKLKEEDAAELRGEINAVLRKGKAPKTNLNKEERIALNQLRKDKRQNYSHSR